MAKQHNTAPRTPRSMEIRHVAGEQPYGGEPQSVGGAPGVRGSILRKETEGRREAVLI